VNVDDQWTQLFDSEVNGNTQQLDISEYVSRDCDHWFEWLVRAQDAEGAWSDWSATPIFYAENPPPPAPVIQVQPLQSDGTVSCFAAPTLSWNRPNDASGIAGYRLVVNFYNDSTGQWVNIIDTYVTSNQYDIGDIPSSYCQKWINAQVIAQDTFGAWSPWSNWVQFYLQFPPPG
jgi:hypothetical protein